MKHTAWLITMALLAGSLSVMADNKPDDDYVDDVYFWHTATAQPAPTPATNTTTTVNRNTTVNNKNTTVTTTVKRTPVATAAQKVTRQQTTSKPTVRIVQDNGTQVKAVIKKK